MINMENINLLESIAKDIELIKKTLSSNQTKRWLTVKELATYLGYSKDRIYKLKDEVFIEEIHFYKKTGKIIFDRVAIDDWVVGKDTDESNKSQREIVSRLLSSIQEV